MGIFSKKRGLKEVSVAALLIYPDGATLDQMVRSTWAPADAAKVPNLADPVAGLLRLSGGPVNTYGWCDETSWFAVDATGDRLIPVNYNDSWALMPFASPGHLASLSPLLIPPKALPPESVKRLVDAGWENLGLDHPFASQIPHQ